MPTKKKQVKKTKTKAENKEKKVKTEEEKRKAKRDKEIKKKMKKIREALQDQLISQNKFGAQFDDLIEHYLYLAELKDILKYDIKDNGIRYEVKTGNGYTTVKANESVKNLATISSEMRKLLEDLNLKEPETTLTGEGDPVKEGEGDDLL